MSDAVFPAIDPPNWSWTWPIKKTPVWSTIIQTPFSGRNELRIPAYQFPRWQFELDLSYAKGSPQDPTSAIGKILAFYFQMQGPAKAWLYDDVFDDTATLSRFGTGDGATHSFPVSNACGLIQNFLTGGSAPTFQVAGTPTTPASLANGIVTFTTAPADGAALTWSGKYYYRCRFLDDQWGDLTQELPHLWSNHALKFISLIS